MAEAELTEKNIEVTSIETRTLLPVGGSLRLAAAMRARADAGGGTRNRRVFYDELVAVMKDRYQISIRKWRSSMRGVAYELHYSNGEVRRMISSPRPRSPVSACIFMHEVGHHAIGFRKFRPRCLEEYHVWQWAFNEMRRWNIAVDHRVERHYRRSMYHYVQLAKKRGIKQLPEVLQQFQVWPG